MPVPVDGIVGREVLPTLVSGALPIMLVIVTFVVAVLAMAATRRLKLRAVRLH